ncbi:ImmA/IrrE family metallo-endopeptidase [bacterium]|nr:ImmA/IrrE family metallo-endopeptidase [bacterium]
MQVKEFSKETLRESFAAFRSLTFCPQDFSQELFKLCSKCGIAVVYLPHFKGTKIHGTTRWFRNKPLIQLTVRWTYSDIFWFTFFHEIAHLYFHGKKETFLNFGTVSISIEEKGADRFACDILIPTESENSDNSLVAN